MLATSRPIRRAEHNIEQNSEHDIMKILRLIRRFDREEAGAVTVDWVVLTAAIVGLGIAVLTTVGGATDDYGQTIGSHLSSQGIKTTY